MTQVSHPKQITVKLFTLGPSCSKGGQCCPLDENLCPVENTSVFQIISQWMMISLTDSATSFQTPGPGWQLSHHFLGSF